MTHPYRRTHHIVVSRIQLLQLKLLLRPQVRNEHALNTQLSPRRLWRLLQIQGKATVDEIAGSLNRQNLDLTLEQAKAHAEMAGDALRSQGTAGLIFQDLETPKQMQPTYANVRLRATFQQLIQYPSLARTLIARHEKSAARSSRLWRGSLPKHPATHMYASPAQVQQQ